MRKPIFTLTAAVMTAGMLFSSCAGNKDSQTQQNEQTEEVAETPIIEPEEDTSTITAEQKEALLASKLVSADDFKHTIFIDFNATWCGPCRQFAPFFKAAAEKYGDRASFIAVDTDEYGEVANAFGVQNIPTMIAVQANGKCVVYVGISELVGDGAFDAIVEKLL